MELLTQHRDWTSFWLPHQWAHRASVIYSASQNYLRQEGRRRFPTRQQAANQKKLRHSSMYDIWINSSRLILWLSSFFKQLKDHKWKIYNRKIWYESHFSSVTQSMDGSSHIFTDICSQPAESVCPECMVFEKCKRGTLTWLLLMRIQK